MSLFNETARTRNVLLMGFNLQMYGIGIDGAEATVALAVDRCNLRCFDIAAGKKQAFQTDDGVVILNGTSRILARGAWSPARPERTWTTVCEGTCTSAAVLLDNPEFCSDYCPAIQATWDDWAVALGLNSRLDYLWDFTNLWLNLGDIDTLLKSFTGEALFLMFQLVNQGTMTLLRDWKHAPAFKWLIRQLARPQSSLAHAHLKPLRLQPPEPPGQIDGF